MSWETDIITNDVWIEISFIHLACRPRVYPDIQTAQLVNSGNRKGDRLIVFKMRRSLTIASLVLLTATSAVAANPTADAWRIGPIIKGRNYSVGMPPAMQRSTQGPAFAFPAEGSRHVHYVTLETGSLEGARQITVRYRIDAAPGTRFVAQEDGSPGTFGLEFQRAGDNWTARGRYEAYRWYSPSAVPLSPGVHIFTARFDDPNWVGVMTSRSGTNPEGFAGALADAESVSMTFGGSSGRGHGVFATAPARFTLLDFIIS